MHTPRMLMWHTYSARLPFAEMSVGFEGWLMAVPASYVPVVRPAREAQINALGIELNVYAAPEDALVRDPYGRPVTVQAEIFSKDGGLFLASWKPVEGRGRASLGDDGSVTYADDDTALLRLGYLGHSLDPSPLDELIESLENRFATELKMVVPASRSFRDVASGAQLLSASEVSPAEVAASRVLSDKLTRQLAIAIKSSSGLLVQNVAKTLTDASPAEIKKALAALEGADLINEEIVVLCSKSSAQVTRVDDRSTLPELAKLGARCACGKSIDEEPAERSLTVSDLASGLIDKSRWLSVLVCRELMDRGISAENILLEHTAGGDEVDCLANIFGSLVLFELKDKPFNLGNAYSFGAKIPIFQPDISVVLTTEHVGRDAKEHFARSRESSRRSVPGRLERDDQSSQISYIEGLNVLPQRLDEIIGQIQRQRARIQVRDALSVISISAAALIDAAERPTQQAGTVHAFETAPTSADPGPEESMGDDQIDE